MRPYELVRQQDEAIRPLRNVGRTPEGSVVRGHLRGNLVDVLVGMDGIHTDRLFPSGSGRDWSSNRTDVNDDMGYDEDAIRHGQGGGHLECRH